MTLPDYIDAWQDACEDLLDLLRSLDAEDWHKPTDLTGWDVHDVAAHVAALEAELAHGTVLEADVEPQPHFTSPMQWYTEAGVQARKGRTPEELIAELEQATRTRAEWLRGNPPTDGTAVPERTPGNIGWNWQTLLSNRVVDVWVHGQDIRRAVDRPGALDTAAARHVVDVFVKALPFVLGKKVKAPAGTVVQLEEGGRVVQVTVGDDGRGRLTEGAEPDAIINLSRETFTVLGAGRRGPGEVEVRIAGDRELAHAVLENMAVTP